VRRVILFLVTSLDGAIAGPQGELDWETRDPEVAAYLIPELLGTVDTMLFGRGLYQGFAETWPGIASNPSMPKELVEFARWIESSPKVVFSNTLGATSWKNSRIVPAPDDGAISDEIARLRREPGGDMVVFGGARFAQTLVRLGLVDEYRLKLQPMALGDGTPLFRDLPERRPLELLKSRAFASGVVVLHYRPAAPSRPPSAPPAP
jgi:dihydrofolate reductase